MKHRAYAEILKEANLPVISIDERGLIMFVNKPFIEAYGWSSDELKGQVVTAIMPTHMRDAHNFGFSRFLVSEQPRILNKALSLPVYCKNKTTIDAVHYITGEKIDNVWHFAATVTPKNGKG